MTRPRPAGQRPSRPAYLGRLDPAVRPHFAKATDLRSFLAAVPALTPRQRKVLARQALILIEQNYVHLPLKRAMHAVDPVQRLKLLLQALEQGAATTQPAEAEFHREMTGIFTSVRDLHTNYLLPAPINEANRYAGSNAEARHARGVQTLTTRALMISLPPDEEWVIVGYRTPAGQMHELRFDWMSNPPLPAGSAEAGGADARGANLRVAMRRSLRVGRRAGTVLEDLGVMPDVRHFMTRDDVLHGNADLINRAGAMLARLPVRELEVTVAATSPTATTLTVTTRGIRRIDAYLAGRPIHSVDVRRGRAVVSVPRTPTAPKTLELQGFDRGRLVARYRTTS